jgi:phospholipase/carboxylesterase
MQTKPLSIHHLLKAPKETTKKAPVIFMLHGYGSNEEDLFSFANELPDEYCIISLRAPYSIVPFGFAWYAIHFDATDGKWSDNEQAKTSRDEIAAFIDEAIEEYNLDKDKVTLLGFSQGCILSFAIALTYPEKVKNVIGLSGYINPDIIPANLPKESYSHLDVYTSHGTVDQVIPVDWARKTAPFLQRLGIKHVYKEFPVGHGVAPQNFFEFKKWLEEKI